LEAVSAEAITNENDVRLSWKASTDVRVKGYEINANGERVAFVRGRMTQTLGLSAKRIETFTHVNTTPDTQVVYTVCAVVTPSLKSLPSEPVQVTIAQDTTPPGPVTDLKFERLDARQVKLTWTPPASDVVRYELVRFTSEEDVVTLTELPGNATEYIDHTRRAYNYGLKAWDDAGNRSAEIQFSHSTEPEQVFISLGEPVELQGVRLPNAGDGAHESSKLGGTICRVNRPSARYFYFDLNDDFASQGLDAETHFYATVEYFDQGTKGFRLETLQGGEIRYASFRQEFGETENWKHVVFPIGALAANQGSFGSDFRLASDEPLALSSVTVSKGRPVAPVRQLAWGILGPFEEKVALDVEYFLPPLGLYRGRYQKDISWFEIRSVEFQTASEFLNLGGLLKSDEGAAYAMTYLESTRRQPVKLVVSGEANDTVGVWLNGVPLKKNFTGSEYPAKLKKGLNRLVIRIANGGNAKTEWGFSFRLLTSEGTSLPKVSSVSPFDVPVTEGQLPRKRPRSPEQAVGPPDTTSSGMVTTAWTPESSNSGQQWLYLIYRIPVHATEVHIYEAYRTGAVVKVELFDENGDAHTVWQGADPTKNSPGEFPVSFSKTDYLTDAVKITLDTNKVSGWNQIDAVQLVGDGHKQWAFWAFASSSYADRYRPPVRVDAYPLAKTSELMTYHGDANVRRQCANYLRREAKDASIPLLSNALEDSDESVLVYAIRELMALKSEIAVKALVAYLERNAPTLSEQERSVLLESFILMEHALPIALLERLAEASPLPADAMAYRYAALNLIEKTDVRKKVEGFIRRPGNVVVEAEDADEIAPPFVVYNAPTTWNG